MTNRTKQPSPVPSGDFDILTEKRSLSSFTLNLSAAVTL